MRRFFIDSRELESKTPMLSGLEFKHARDVLRLKPNDRILVFDGKGKIYEAEIRAIQHDRIEIGLRQEHPGSSESPLELIVSQALLKGQKMDELIRPLTELGMTAWRPFIAERSIPVPDMSRMTRRVDRWRKIALESMKQCGRRVCPDIFPPVTFAQMIQQSTECQGKLFFWEKASQSLTEAFPESAKTGMGRVQVVIGPEGGFSEEEADYAAAQGFYLISLGLRILKSDTAAISACAIAQHRFGDL